MADLKKLASNAAMLGGAALSFGPKNSDSIESKLRYQFFADETEAYTDLYGPLASNVYDTEAQGIDLNDWYKYVPIRIRVQPAAQSTTGETMLDDWQKFHIIAPTSVNYIGQGALMTFEGNTWIVYKPQNVGGVIGGGVIRRCNSVINVLDYYGNIVSIPMSFARMSTQGNAPQVSENMILSKNYISCICQLNDYTKEFTENSRLILGKAAYAMRGLNDFTREFTEDQDSAHLLTFTIERTEPLEQDSIELQCADYYSFSWEIQPRVATLTMNPGSTQEISFESLRNGAPVTSSEEQPITYQCVVTAGADYLRIEPAATPNHFYVTAENASLQEAQRAEIQVSLAENPDITESLAFVIQNTYETSLRFTSGATVTQLRGGESVTLEAYLVDSAGSSREQVITFTLSGAPRSAYEATISGNSASIRCFGASQEPLVIAASDGANTITHTIWLLA